MLYYDIYDVYEGIGANKAIYVKNVWFLILTIGIFR